jgi:23S rRNA (cytidine1920-2'-O)/16S rRNA (cytidine1409-2'-O)-methyltransferase
MAQRLDKELVARGLFASRAKAQEAIDAGVVVVNGAAADKASLKVSADDDLAIAGETLAYVSRAGLKLEHAIEVFDIDLSGRKLLDIGSSTGGFTDCALQKGAVGSFAVDVGRDQLAPKLRGDSRVVVMEGRDFRELDPGVVEDADIASIDVSFISATKLVDNLARMSNVIDVVCLIKPQFECGKEVAHRFRGVPLDKQVHAEAISSVVAAFAEGGFACQGVCASPIRGLSGNVEYLAHFTRGADSQAFDIQDVVERTFETFGI